MFLMRLLTYVGSALCCITLHAGSDPIAWRATHFPAITQAGVNYEVTYTLTNRLPLTLVHPLEILKTASPSGEFSYLDGCSGRRLRAGQRCRVRIRFAPSTVGRKSVMLTVAGYNRDKVPLPRLTTETYSASVGKVVGTVPVPLSNTFEFGQSQGYSFLFTNYNNNEAKNVVGAVSQTSGAVNVTHNSCGTSVLPGSLEASHGTCTISGTFTPDTKTPARQTVTARLTFTDAVTSPTSVSTSTNVTASDSDIVASVHTGLPGSMLQSETFSVEFLFTNVSDARVTLSNTGTVTCSGSDSSNCILNVTDVVSSCNSFLPAPNPTAAACSITLKFNAPVATNPVTTYTIMASLAYVGTGTPATATTAGIVVPSQSTSRTFIIKNQCNFDVWYSFNGGAVSGYDCSNCPTGTSCNSERNACFWENFPNTTGESVYKLVANTGETTVTIPAPSFNAGTIQWSGGISASTLCNGSSSCQEAGCSNHGGSTACAAGVGFQQPATQSEFTLLLNNPDTYDSEVINGFHLPISMQPFVYESSGVIHYATPNNYLCGAPGLYFTTPGTVNGFGPADWSTASTPNSNYYYLVTSGGGSCTNGCTGGKVCGLTSDLSQVCGNFLGYWTPNQVCNQSASTIPAAVSQYFQCTSPTGFNLPGSANTYAQLMGCPVATGYTGPTYNSCYTTTYQHGAAVQQCCGCVDWWEPSQTVGHVSILTNSTAITCPAGQTDPLWTSNIQAGIQWMKKACPSCYVYPFDDASGNFNCTNNAAGESNSTGYVVTFCPGGNTGLPSGANEGRGTTS